MRGFGIWDKGSGSNQSIRLMLTLHPQEGQTRGRRGELKPIFLNCSYQIKISPVNAKSQAKGEPCATLTSNLCFYQHRSKVTRNTCKSSRTSQLASCKYYANGHTDEYRCLSCTPDTSISTQMHVFPACKHGGHKCSKHAIVPKCATDKKKKKHQRTHRQIFNSTQSEENYNREVVRSDCLAEWSNSIGEECFT